MIFYFSATGNSYYIAKQLAKEFKCQMVDMSLEPNEKHSFDLQQDEPVGFVFPVYFYTVNDVVMDYIRNLSIKGNGYTYAIVTCGGSIGGTGGLLKSELKKRGIRLDNVYSLLMPDNAVFYYNVVDEERAKQILETSDKCLVQIIKNIDEHITAHISKKGLGKIMRPIYHLASSTKRFFVTKDCINCGMCEKNCPTKAIEIKDGVPVWAKDHCAICSACINRCPVKAIQYGKGTRKRNRYYNPYIDN